MFFEDDDGFFNPQALHGVRHKLSSNLNATPYGLRSVPTHTEDGIPIRKLYVSNIPLKTTCYELRSIFSQYGAIKSCWLRNIDNGQTRGPAATYAFVTYCNPSDAHKALLAPNHEKTLRGRHLRTSPADSWHQPAEDENGYVRWKPYKRNNTHHSSLNESSSSGTDLHQVVQESCVSDNGEGTSSETHEAIVEEPQEENGTCNILDVLNRDCMNHILSFVPITDLIRSERVSKEWQNMVLEYLEGWRTLKTSWWQHGSVTLTTAVLRRVLQRVGAALARLHVDHHWSALNDRTAHTIGKFCPRLEELKIVGMYTKNWNPLLYGCKRLKNLSFISCNKLTDSSLVHLVKSEDSVIETLTIANNTHVTGLFLTGSNQPKLKSLTFHNCYNLQGTVLCAVIDKLPCLTTLKLDVCPVTMWKIIPMILTKLGNLEELSLSQYSCDDVYPDPQGNDSFCEALSKLSNLKILNLSRNVYITNAVLKVVAQTCTKLESLNISSCNSRRIFPHAGVGDEGIKAVTSSCNELRNFNVSYLAALTDAGLASVSRLAHLNTLTVRGCSTITASSLCICLAACRQLQELDASGCEGVCERAVAAAVEALTMAPRPLTLHLAATAAAAFMEELPTHKLLKLNVSIDRCDPHLRPDFVDTIFDNYPDESIDDLFDHENLEDYLGSDDDDELFMDDEYDEYDDNAEAVFAFCMVSPGHHMLL